MLQLDKLDLDTTIYEPWDYHDCWDSPANFPLGGWSLLWQAQEGHLRASFFIWEKWMKTVSSRLAVVRFLNLPNPVWTWFRTWGSGIRFSRMPEPEPLGGFRFKYRPNLNLGFEPWTSFLQDPNNIFLICLKQYMKNNKSALKRKQVAAGCH